EGREGPDALDLVAEELHAQRLPPRRREDVDQVAANGELPALVDSLDALVADERKLLGKLFMAADGAQRDPRGPLCRNPLGHRRRGRTDKPAPPEHVEGPRPLADEVRR